MFPEITINIILSFFPPTAAVGRSSSQLKRNEMPKEHELDRIDYNGETIRIFSSSAARWEKIATRLYFDGNTIQSIKKSSFYQTTDACKAIFNEWLNGREGLREPRTWATVVEILKEADLSTLN